MWSEQLVHEPLVDIETFEAVQGLFGRTTGPTRRAPAEGRHYLLSGLVRCGLCGRRMQGQWNHGKLYYRCKFPVDYGVDPDQHPRSVYVKEEAVVLGLDDWLAELFNDEHLEHTCDVLAGAAEPDAEVEWRQATLREEIAACDWRLAKYRTLLDQLEDVTVVAGWMAEVQRERKRLEAQLGQQVPGGTLSGSQVKALVGALRGIVDVLADADPADRAEAYQELGVNLTYHPDGRVAVQALPRGADVGVGGPSRPLRTQAHQRSEALPLGL